MTISETLKKRLKILGAILAIFVIFFIGYSIWNFWDYQISAGWGTNAEFGLTEINESATPHGNIIHLTEEDFKIFPKLAPAIRDKTQRVMGVYDNGSRISYTIHLTDDEYEQFKSLYFPPNPDNLHRFFEYNGKYYEYDYPAIS
jgi:hypothetical protein